MNKMTIYIARYKSSMLNSSGHSAPCSNCLQKIKQLGIKKIVYVDCDGNIKKCKTKDYYTEHVCPGYKEYYKQNISVD